MAPVRVEGDALDSLHGACDRLGIPHKERRTVLEAILRLYAPIYPQPCANVAPIPLAQPQTESKPAFKAL